ncbi:MAG TPA: response regulator transcription factor [Acidimicrobiales bacterium]|nr:response regulator transcription factor [Acidimicrobiales bacterium]
MNGQHTAATVLLVEDEADVREMVALTLEAGGYAVVEVSDGMQAFDRLDAVSPDLVVLDLMLPVVSGLEVLQAIRQHSNVPVLVLTALGSEENRVRGLQLGADDYVTKPFSPRELVARVQALLRRSSSAAARQTVVLDGLTIDMASREVWVVGRFVETTAKEFDLLAFLAANPGRVYTRHQLLREVWHSSSEWQQEGTVTEHVRRLRAKIEDDPARPLWLQTVRGVGYRFERRRQPRPAGEGATPRAAVA